MPLRSALIALVLAAGGAAQPSPRLEYRDPFTASPAPSPRLDYVDLVAPASGLPAPTDAPEPPAGAVRAFYGDRLEWTPEGDAFGWDASAEIGSERHRLWLASAGDASLSGFDYVELQALYSRPVSASGIAIQAGLRQDLVPRPRRTYAVIGFQGNVSDPLYVGAFGFLSHRGELSGRLFAYYDLPLVGRLILQPAFEAELAARDVPALGIGAGPVYAEAGLRLRYRMAEPFAPYVGINWERLLGRTAGIARAAGEEVDSTSVVLGVRSYF